MESNVRVIGACDVAWGGGDSLSMPIGYEYPNGDVYIPSWIFNKGPKEVTIPIVTGKIIGEKLTEIQFEANNGGDMYSDRVSTELEKHNYHCSCSYKKAPGNMEKTTKMVAYSGDIKKHFIFLDPEHQDQEYSDAMDELNMTVQIGDNEHDDAGDGITQLAMKIYGGYTEMKITRKDIANYKLLGVLLEKDRQKLADYIEKRPSCYAGKVYGSNPQFPYEPRGFSVSGCNEYEIAQMKEWEQKCREMEVKVQEDIDRLKNLTIGIDRLIADCTDLEDKMILEYVKDGKSQQQIAMEIGLDQSIVSRRIKKYVSE